MFTTTNARSPLVTTGKLNRVVFDVSNLDALNADLEYQEGYMLADEFISLGVNKLHIANTPATTDDDGNAVPAVTDYSDFLSGVEQSGTIDVDLIEAYIVTKQGA